ncbi:hypothetical protein L861_04545 [Litchfieldella anticariensis FP35 = DSM 16096]|uniref:Uncharacterized protein n=1 Tax=Litchfieldella anticariensis (strain DSM 16096 / CECT 5854 / CIP 108499 / LMG 22089 / FP35) TaxID=1121939 RepID=S2KR86_LITA3|nr:hypothetical protein L861_04545 [Halomonas anticariensis FP35 = DSM 16096]
MADGPRFDGRESCLCFAGITNDSARQIARYFSLIERSG